MAFNFNWSPLIADTTRAREMLTTALNKSPKPPIIVDDIFVNELNLGRTPPDLEILEIGDLAEDRFRGIFKMSYTGDAFLTLKTRVQANPLNTYLSMKPSFASPQPLAAASGLTIPLQITLSDFRLSGFVILVFSRQKGLTIVFRNDPLESLKVSSTFDSIPFVRDYLQKEIEGQLRNLFMEDLPAILHRLSLRLWVPEYRDREEEEARQQSKKDEEKPIDPLASPPQDPVNANAGSLDEDFSTFSLDSNGESHASFSQKNLLRLAALNDSQRTLSLFTPMIRDAVFRAWAGSNDRVEFSGTSTPSLTASGLSRIQSSFGNYVSTASAASSVTGGSDTGTFSSRPSLASFASTHGTTYSMGGPRSKPGRKRKNRVVNLRRGCAQTEGRGAGDEASTADASSTPTTPPSASSSSVDHDETRENEDELVTPPSSPNASAKVRFQETQRQSVDPEDSPPRRYFTPKSHKSPLVHPAPTPSSQAKHQDTAAPPGRQAHSSTPRSQRPSERASSSSPLNRPAQPQSQLQPQHRHSHLHIPNSEHASSASASPAHHHTTSAPRPPPALRPQLPTPTRLSAPVAS